MISRDEIRGRREGGGEGGRGREKRKNGRMRSGELSRDVFIERREESQRKKEDIFPSQGNKNMIVKVNDLSIIREEQLYLSSYK